MQRWRRDDQAASRLGFRHAGIEYDAPAEAPPTPQVIGERPAHDVRPVERARKRDVGNAAPRTRQGVRDETTEFGRERTARKELEADGLPGSALLETAK